MISRKSRFSALIISICMIVVAFNANTFAADIGTSTSNQGATRYIENGTYYFKNVQFSKYAQIDNNASSNEDAFLELWDHDGASDQKWVITKLDNTYYRITSAVNGKAITAPSSDNESLTLAAYSSTNYAQQWIINNTASGYKLSPRSNTSKYMAAGDGVLISSGRNVEMRTNQSDNKDEWYILSTTKKYTQVSLGFTGNASLNNTVQPYYEHTAHAYGKTYTSITETLFKSEMTSSNYFCAVLHGGEKENKLQISDYETLYLDEIASLDFSAAKIIILTSCYSGRPGGFVDTLLAQGADVVIGFYDDVEQVTGAYWTERFIYYLTLGNSVQTSLYYADNDLYDEYQYTIYNDVIPYITLMRTCGTSDLSLIPCS